MLHLLNILNIVPILLIASSCASKSPNSLRVENHNAQDIRRVAVVIDGFERTFGIVGPRKYGGLAQWYGLVVNQSEEAIVTWRDDAGTVHRKAVMIDHEKVFQDGGLVIIRIAGDNVTVHYDDGQVGPP